MPLSIPPYHEQSIKIREKIAETNYDATFNAIKSFIDEYDKIQQLANDLMIFFNLLKSELQILELNIKKLDEKKRSNQVMALSELMQLQELINIRADFIKLLIQKKENFTIENRVIAILTEELKKYIDTIQPDENNEISETFVTAPSSPIPSQELPESSSTIDDNVSPDKGSFTDETLVVRELIRDRPSNALVVIDDPAIVTAQIAAVEQANAEAEEESRQIDIKQLHNKIDFIISMLELEKHKYLRFANKLKHIKIVLLRELKKTIVQYYYKNNLITIIDGFKKDNPLLTAGARNRTGLFLACLCYWDSKRTLNIEDVLANYGFNPKLLSANCLDERYKNFGFSKYVGSCIDLLIEKLQKDFNKNHFYRLFYSSQKMQIQIKALQNIKENIYRARYLDLSLIINNIRELPQYKNMGSSVFNTVNKFLNGVIKWDNNYREKGVGLLAYLYRNNYIAGDMLVNESKPRVNLVRKLFSLCCS